MLVPGPLIVSLKVPVQPAAATRSKHSKFPKTPARRRGALQPEDPQVERRRATEQGKIQDRAPLRHAESSSDREAARCGGDHDEHPRADSHARRNETERARSRDYRLRPDRIESHA